MSTSMGRVFVASAVALVLLQPTLALAQSPVRGGTIEVSGATGFVGSFQTVSPDGADDDVDVTNASAGFGLYFYTSGLLGFGVSGNFARASTTVGDADLTTTNTLFGPDVKLRFGADRVQLVLIGGAGYTKAKIEAGDAEIVEGVDATDFEIDGLYYQAGGQVDFFLNNAVSVGIGARYQASMLTDSDDAEFDIAGLAVTLGLSVYLD